MHLLKHPEEAGIQRLSLRGRVGGKKKFGGKGGLLSKCLRGEVQKVEVSLRY